MGLLIGIIFFVIGLLISQRLKSKFKEYSQIPVASGMSGKEIAERMLRDHDIQDVKVMSVQGQLTDHYNPMNKTINLSQDVYNGRSVSAAAVAAHETGHAVQHATAYGWLQMRSTLVPVVNFSAMLVQWVILGGVLMMNVFPQLLLIGIGLFAMITIFSVITLPVEFDASNRALAWLDNKRIAIGEEHRKAKDALWWAAMTYVVAALASIASLLYYIMIYLNRRD